MKIILVKHFPIDLFDNLNKIISEVNTFITNGIYLRTVPKSSTFKVLIFFRFFKATSCMIHFFCKRNIKSNVQLKETNLIFYFLFVIPKKLFKSNAQGQGKCFKKLLLMKHSMHLKLVRKM